MMRKALKSKRGIMIESAILLMLVLSLLSIVLSFVVIGMHTRTKTDRTLMERRLTLEQIGDAFVAGELDIDSIPDNYSVITADNNRLHLVFNNNTTVLYIEKDANGNVITWRYSAPPTQE